MNKYGETRYREKNLNDQTKILFLENGNRVRWETLNRLAPGRKLGVATWVSSTDSKLRPRRTARRALSGASGQQLWWASICMLSVGSFLWFEQQMLSSKKILGQNLGKSLTCLDYILGRHWFSAAGENIISIFSGLWKLELYVFCALIWQWRQNLKILKRMLADLLKCIPKASWN